MIRGPLIALGVVVLLFVAGAMAYVFGIGPLVAPTAARSVVFVAVSRSTNETDAREIEAIDLTAGTRDLFDAGGRITAMALSPDRRSLYVALDGGRIVFLDATTGIEFGDVDLHGPSIVSLSPTSDGRLLLVVAGTNVSSSIVPIDLATRKATEPIPLPATAGPATLRGDTLVVPLIAGGLQVAFVDVAARAVTSRLTLPRGSLGFTPAAFPITTARTGIIAFDPGITRGAGLRVYAVTDAQHWSDVSLQAQIPQGPGAQLVISLYAAASTDGTIHVCSTGGTIARRYVLSPDLKSTSAGTDCGPLAGGDRILMAKRDPPQLLVLDDKTGKTVRTLPLAGVPARLVH